MRPVMRKVDAKRVVVCGMNVTLVKTQQQRFYPVARGSDGLLRVWYQTVGGNKSQSALARKKSLLVRGMN